MKFDQLSVLLVEPSLTQKRIICDYLHDFGIQEINHEQAGKPAINEIKKGQPDLVISAMHLSDMTGVDLVESIRSDATLSNIAFMLISSETDIRYLEPIRQAGALAILPKPFEPEQLKKALFTTLDYLDPETIELENYYAEELRILVVDDSRTSRKHIIRTLTGMGIENFIEAEDGKQAVDELSKNHFDLIVTDYNMPEMDGKELIAYIREHSSLAGLPVMMVTSETDMSRLAGIEQSGVSAICDKPFEPATIKQLVKNLLS